MPMVLPVSPCFVAPTHTENFGVGRRLPVRDYLDRLADYLGAAEAAGFVGAFVYDFPGALDPWLATCDLLDHSATLQPIVAVRPHIEAAASVARRLVDLHYRYDRPIHVNLVSGATGSSRSVADLREPEARRRRLAEYAEELRTELGIRNSHAPPRNLVLTPASSTPGRVGADCVLTMARPRPELASVVSRIAVDEPDAAVAVLLGMVVRPSTDQAWAAAAKLFPPDRRQEVAGRLFGGDLVSSEHRAWYRFAEQAEIHDDLLWYGAPAGVIDAPKLVGSAEQVGRWLADCLRSGITDVIVDLPAHPDEFAHVGRVLRALFNPAR